MIISKTIIVITSLFVVLCSDFSSDEYLKLSANNKIEKLWSEITKDRNSSVFDNVLVVLKNLSVLDLHPTFEAKGDVFPEGRKKLLHTVGCVAKANWLSSGNHTYTGIFKGSKSFLVRYSAATAPDTKKTSAAEAENNFIPGISLKFLRDGVDSANLVALNSASGGPSWNPFAFDFKTYFQLKNNITGPLDSIFPTLSPFVTSSGLKDTSEYDENGKKVDKPYYPFQLIFRPSVNVKTMFSESYSKFFLDQLEEISADTPLYDVYALDQPDCPEVKIATIKITTKFSRSKWGDEKLFFRHGRIEKDDAGKNWSTYRDFVSLITGRNKAPVPVKKSACPFSPNMQASSSILLSTHYISLSFTLVIFILTIMN